MTKTHEALALVVLMALGALFALGDPAAAAILTVGPGGAFATVQEAIDAAQATPQDDELRLRATTFFEHLELFDSDLGGRLEISGGWDAAYAVRDESPGATVLDGGGTGRVLMTGFITAGELVLRGLTFRNGRVDSSPWAGGGLYLGVNGTAATLEDCHFDSNLTTTTQGTFGATGGGAALFAVGSGQIRVAGVSFTGNDVEIDDSIGAPLGGGAHIGASGSSQVLVRHGVASGNALTGGSQRRGGGIQATVSDSALLEIEDFLITDNHGDTAGAGEVWGHGIDLGANESGVLTLRRLEITDNWNGTGDDTAQVRLNLFGGSVNLTDSLVARGGVGLDLGTNTSTVRLTNLTITGHESLGAFLFAGAPGSVVLTNSIAWDNAGGDVVFTGGAATGSFNLVGVDPLFVAPGAGDYRLSALSPAVGAGTASPAGGLGPFDLAHASRIVGALPDQGALERGAIFADGFERADTRAWSLAVD